MKRHPEYEFHPIADIFPLMAEAALKFLAMDIKANGLQVPIVLYQGKMLDGRNRYLACKIAGVEPQFTEYEGSEPIKHALSLNLNRRHLDSSQRAAIAAELANMRREDTLLRNRTDPQNCAAVKISQAEAADMAGGVSLRYVTEAVSLKKTDPPLFARLRGSYPRCQLATHCQARLEPHRCGALHSVDTCEGVPV
jgi:hypothetical protein